LGIFPVSQFVRSSALNTEFLGAYAWIDVPASSMATEAVLVLPIPDPHSSPEHSPPTSPGAAEATHADAQLQTLNKKKKKKKSKKPKCKNGAPAIPGPQTIPEHRQPVLCISRNKHWKYISSYHVCHYVVPWAERPADWHFDRDHGCNCPWRYLNPYFLLI
jgi:hypothetical protein